MLYISQILNFDGKRSDIPIYKTLENSWILKTLRKENIFLYSNRQLFFDLFSSLGVAIFRVTLRDHAQIFLKKATIYENDMTLFFFFSFSLHGSNVNSENVNEKISLILCDVCYSAS